MSKHITFHRWNSNPWKLYELVGIAWASAWQIVDAPTPERAWLAIANLVGSSIIFVALHIRDRTTSRNVERWAYLALIYSMGVYLSLALHYEGWIGLVHQTNLGVMLVAAIIMGSFHRSMWLTFGRWHIRRKAAQEDELIADAKAIVEHYTDEC
jgi:hypothetical protein